MSDFDRWSTPRAKFMNRLHARLAAVSRQAGGFISQPEPRTVGHFAKGRQLVAGNFQFAGHLIEAENDSMWALTPPSRGFEEDLHGFAWLDDLAAVGDANARARAQDWTYGWINAYGKGRGPGWIPDLAGRRVIRWVNHALFLLGGVESPQSKAFFRSLTQQTVFLSRRWAKSVPGLPRFEALCGLIYAGLALSGMERHVPKAVAALARECSEQISEQGGLPTRNPEELLEVFTLLCWAAAALEETGRDVAPEITAAIERIAPTLRALRHADGGLARFHGGGRGVEGRLDHALATSGVRAAQPKGLSMGFARVSAGRTSLIVDAAPPPIGVASQNAHASTAAFELTSGRRPLIVNCGAGGSFGADWRRAGRATPSHSTLGLDGMSSSRIGEAVSSSGRRRELLIEVPDDVPLQKTRAPDGTRVQVGHNGYRRSHGLTHARTLDVTLDGRGMAGEDLLTTLDDADKRRFDLALDASTLQGVAFSIRFHLHPDVDARLDLGGSAVSMQQKSGEIWVFRHDGTAELSLEPSAYLEKGRLKPRLSDQIVLTARATTPTTRVRWSLAKAKDTPLSIRDVKPDNPDEIDDLLTD